MEHSLCLRIDGFLNGLFPGGQVPASDVHLGLNKRSQAFLEVLNHDLLIWSCSGIKFFKDRLQVLQVGCLVEDFL